MPLPRVLIAEDDPQLRELYAHVLRRSSRYAVRVARDGQEALRLALSWRPDLLLLDIDMPDLDGFSVLERLPTPRQFPVAMLSSFDDDANRRRADELGADAFYCKTELTIDTFLQAVKLLLKGRAVA